MAGCCCDLFNVVGMFVVVRLSRSFHKMKLVFLSVLFNLYEYLHLFGWVTKDVSWSFGGVSRMLPVSHGFSLRTAVPKALATCKTGMNLVA